MSENENKPDLKLVQLDEVRKIRKEVELQEENKVDEFTTNAVKLYTMSRELFSDIEDPQLYFEAVNHLRTAFLLALNPLQKIDERYEVIFEEYEDEDDYDE